jgi:hypothetical protein
MDNEVLERLAIAPRGNNSQNESGRTRNLPVENPAL